MFRVTKLAVKLSLTICLASPYLISAERQQKKFQQLVVSNRYNLLKLFLYFPKINPKANNNAAISYACRSGSVETVETLLNDSRVDLPFYCVQSVICRNNINMLKVLLESGKVDPNDYVTYSLYHKQTNTFDVLRQHPKTKIITIYKALEKNAEFRKMVEENE